MNLQDIVSFKGENLYTKNNKNKELIIDAMNKVEVNVKRNKKKNITLIGLGPHAKRIYINYFKKHKVNLALLVELESNKESIKSYLEENGFKNTKLFLIPDKEKDKIHLPDQISSNLLAVCKTMEITHIIIATEPKAHNMYVEFALKNNIEVLTDKPITVTKNMTSVASIMIY